MKQKEAASFDFYAMTLHSWTYGKLTEPEKTACNKLLLGADVFGSYKQRWAQFQNIYSAFLAGCGYRNTGTWRD